MHSLSTPIIIMSLALVFLPALTPLLLGAHVRREILHGVLAVCMIAVIVVIVVGAGMVG